MRAKLITFSSIAILAIVISIFIGEFVPVLLAVVIDIAITGAMIEIDKDTRRLV